MQYHQDEMTTEAKRPTTYRAALYGDIPLTGPDQADLDEDALVAAAIEEARKPEALGLELTERHIRIDTWTE